VVVARRWSRSALPPYDAYGIGWSPSKLTGSACGAAHAPTSAANVFHFLKVTVSGNDGYRGAD